MYFSNSEMKDNFEMFEIDRVQVQDYWCRKQFPTRKHDTYN